MLCCGVNADLRIRASSTPVIIVSEHASERSFRKRGLGAASYHVLLHLGSLEPTAGLVLDDSFNRLALTNPCTLLTLIVVALRIAVPQVLRAADLSSACLLRPRYVMGLDMLITAMLAMAV